MHALFVDFSAAFDTIDRELLWNVMQRMGVSSGLINRIKEIYKNTISIVRTGLRESKEFRTTRGLRQGCPLSPILFALYIADLDVILEKGQAGGVIIGNRKIMSLAYADDLVILAQKGEEMLEILKRLEIYANKRKLCLNTEKSKMMTFKKGRRRKNEPTWTWMGEPIEEVNEFKYLGFRFYKNNKKDKHVEEIARRGLIAIKQVWGLGERIFGEKFKSRLMLFDSLIQSFILYAAEVWGWSGHAKLEAIQIKYIKWILRLENVTPGYLVLEETKRKRISVETGKRALKFETEIRAGKRNKILTEIMKELDERN